MFIHTIDCHDWPEYEPNHSQEQVASLRRAIAEIQEQLEALDLDMPQLDEPALEDLKNIKWFIQRVRKLFDDWPEYWSEAYLDAVDDA